VTRSDYAEAAAMLRRLLTAVDDGYLTVGTLKGLALMRRMEGAAVTFELLAQTATAQPFDLLSTAKDS
jgi:hypothetical protein